ncbi:MAG: formate C-acetyltransferase [Acholeplasmatales bacterium]|jgi:formate C-acetyltransferase|nr:formate C-acetyltransferase [Acholeplasmatales bacterium]
MINNPWESFKNGKWNKEIDVEDFINKNYIGYDGDESFLEGAAYTTETLQKNLETYLDIERKKGVVSLDSTVVSGILSHGVGYLNSSLEKIVGLQTNVPLKRGFFPEGGIRVATKACESYGYDVPSDIKELYTNVRKTHNHGVFDAYTDEIMKARHTHLLLGLPDSYNRGRRIGDYRRVALYGVDKLIEEKRKDKNLIVNIFDDETIRLREELQEQIRALKELKALAELYGYDISKPASNAKEAIQWLYFGYLASIKQQNGAAMSVGRIDSFIDIYISRDIKNEILGEKEAQELVDHFVQKLRMVRFARTPEYNSLFSGDPVWATVSIGGVISKDKHLVTKTTYRFLNTLYTMGTSPEPNLTVLWSENLPQNFKKYCAKVSIETSAIQYENDDLIRPVHGHDYGIACCVSPMEIGKESQYFGARANLPKCLLYAINDGKDEITGEQITPSFNNNISYVDINNNLIYEVVLDSFKKQMAYLAKIYVEALNIIHYMHDKYSYEKIQMALVDTHIKTFFATGLAGISIVADSLSAIKFAKVTPIKDTRNIIVDYKIDGDFPRYGNNDDRVDSIIIECISFFMSCVRQYKTYRNSEPTLSLLTITSNVVYGTHTGNTPDGRRAGEPFSPGANPSQGKDNTGMLNSLLSTAKLPFKDCQDGISNTFQILPSGLGKNLDSQKENLSSVINGYFNKGGYHLNINVFNKELLLDAFDNPDKYPNLTIRVSGYAVRFNSLTANQKKEVMSRTIHER